MEYMTRKMSDECPLSHSGHSSMASFILIFICFEEKSFPKNFYTAGSQTLKMELAMIVDLKLLSTVH